MHLETQIYIFLSFDMLTVVCAYYVYSVSLLLRAFLVQQKSCNVTWQSIWKYTFIAEQHIANMVFYFIVSMIAITLDKCIAVRIKCKKNNICEYVVAVRARTLYHPH